MWKAGAMEFFRLRTGLQEAPSLSRPVGGTEGYIEISSSSTEGSVVRFGSKLQFEVRILS